MTDCIIRKISDWAKKQPDKTAVCELRRTVTYSEYWSAIRRTATALMRHGVENGTHVLLITRQSIDFLTIFSALQYIGAFPIPLERSVTDDRILEISGQLDAEVIVSDRLIASMRCIEMNILMKEQESCPEAELEFPASDTPSILLYTTGTTGSSKGVIQLHSNSCAFAENVVKGTEMKTENVQLIPTPLNHALGIHQYEANMYNGSTVCLMDGLVYLGTMWKMMEKYKVNAITMVPSGLKMIIERSGEHIADFAQQIDYFVFASAPLLFPDRTWMREHFPKARLYNIYGSSEAGCCSILNFNSDDDCPGCIGKPMVYSLMRINDENGVPMDKTDSEHTGLLAWGGRIVAAGYYNAPELTARTFKNGFVQTNDIAYIDEKGRCILCGRADDVINVGGSKVAPLEVEECAQRYGGIRECACMPIPDKITGEAPALLVVEGEGYVQSELENILTQTLEFYKLPRKIVSVPELPKTFNGKLARREIKNRLKEWIKE